MTLPETPTRTVRLGASWLVSSTDSATKQAGRVTHVVYAGGYLYIASLGADRLERVAGGAVLNINSLVRVSVATLEYDPTWVVNFNLSPSACEIYSLQTDGTTVYIGGNFSSITINGATSSRSGIAAVNGQTGVITSQFTGFNISPTTVRALALDGDILYVGGDFTSVNGSGRTRLAAVDVTTSNLTSWNPGAGSRVNDMDICYAASGTQVIVGMNSPSSLGGSGSYTFGAVSTAGTRVWGANPSPAGVNAVCAAPSGTRAAAGAKGSNAQGGNTAWVYTTTGTLAYPGIQTNGDLQAIAIGKLSYAEEMLFIGTHDFGFASSPTSSPTAITALGFAMYTLSAGQIQPFRPHFGAGSPGPPWTGSFLKVWSLEVIESLGWLVVGGDFTQVKQTNGTTISPAPYRVAVYKDSGGPPPPPPPPPPPNDPGRFTLMTAGGSTTDGSSFATASISPVAGKPVFIGIAASRTDSIQPSAPSVTGGNITFVLQSEVAFDTTAPEMSSGWVFTGITLTPGVGPVTIGFGTQPIASCVWDVIEASTITI